MKTKTTETHHWSFKQGLKSCLQRGAASSGLLKHLFLSFSIVLCFTEAQAQLIGWDASNNGGGFGATPWTPVTLNSNLTMVNTGLIRGANILTSGTPAGGCWGGGGGGWGTTDPGSVYFSFTANAGYEVSLSSISSALRRSSSFPSSCNIEYSVNGGAYVALATWNIAATSGTTGTPNTTSLSGISALQSVAAGTVIKFRITFPGASGGNWYVTNSTNCLKLNGTVVAVPSCTAPAGLAASNVTANSTDLNWDSISGISGYEYVIDQTAALPAGSGTATATNSVSAAGLSASTVYYAHVRTDCGGSYSSWSTVSFTTATGCVSPSVTAIAQNTAVCSGKTLGLSVTATGTALSYTWTGAGTIASPNASLTSVTNPTSSIYTVSISNACGTASAAVNVTVNPLPAITSATTAVCAGSTATLTASGAATYTWSSGQTMANATVSPSANTSYTVTGTDANGCQGSTTTSVSVNALPVISAAPVSVCAGQTATLSASGANTYTWSTSQSGSTITVNPASTTVYTVRGEDLTTCVGTATTAVTIYTLPVVSASSASVCAGTTATLTASGATTYTWNATQAGTSLTVAPAATSVYTVEGTDAHGCIGQSTATVTVYNLPSVSATSASVCAGGTATLNASGAVTYTWSTSQTTQSISVNPSATTGYTVDGTDANGCVAQASATVLVNALPAISANSPSVCAGGTATLTAMGASTYTWSTFQTGQVISVSPTATTAYTVAGTDLNGCMNLFVLSVTVNAAPSITVNSATVCSGQVANLTASGVTTYTWNNGSNNNFINVNPTATTVYTVSGHLAGCPVAAMQTATVTVQSLPVVSIFSISTVLCNTSGTVNLAGTPSGGSFSGSGVTGNVFNPQTAGTGTFVVSYTYTNTNGCSNSAHATVMVTNCTGIEDLASGQSLLIYPNPVQEQLHIRIENAGSYKVSIHDLTGALVYSESLSGNEQSIPVGQLSKGVYVLSISTTDGTVNRRFIVH